MILNNLMSAKSVSSNCEPDHSIALLTDVHDLIENYISGASVFPENIENQPDDVYAYVLFDPEYKDQQLNFFESESLTQAANLVRWQILGQCTCNDCKSELQPNIDEEQSIPPPCFIQFFEKIFTFLLQTIPTFASQKNLKKIVVDEIKKNFVEEGGWQNYEESMIGCVEHNEEIINKTVDLTTFYALKLFIKNINDFLSGKIKVLPNEPSNIQQLAHTFWMKKTTRIGKHSDKFKI